MTHSSDCLRMSIVSSLSSSSIESQIYDVVFLTPSSCSSEGSHASSVSPDSFSLSSRGVFNDVFVSHQISLFFEALGKKVGAAIAGRPCNPSFYLSDPIDCLQDVTCGRENIG
jgi:hypothetical protein